MNCELKLRRMREIFLLILTCFLLFCNCKKFEKSLPIKDGFYFNCRGEALRLNYPENIWLFSPVPTIIELSNKNNMLIDPNGNICCSINSEFIPHFYNNSIELVYRETCCLKCYNGKDPRLFDFFEFSNKIQWDSIQIGYIDAVGKFLSKTYFYSDTCSTKINNQYKISVDNELEIIFSGKIDQLILSSRSNPLRNIKLFLGNGRVISKDVNYFPSYLTNIKSLQFRDNDFLTE